MDGMQYMATAMSAARAQLETATHNLANVSTDGYRRFHAQLTLTRGGVAAAQTTTFEQGAIRQTGRRFDLAILGRGGFDVGGATTRSGAFVSDRDGYLSDDRGRRLIGESGAVRVTPLATIAPDGTVREGEHVVNRIPLPAGSKVQSGALETSNVDAIGETLSILTSQRAFETAEKVLVAIDDTRQKAVNDVARLK